MRDFRLSDAAASEMEQALLARSGKIVRREIVFLCPSHDDQKPSASYNLDKHVWTCRVCGAGGGYINLTEALGWA